MSAICYYDSRQKQLSRKRGDCIQLGFLKSYDKVNNAAYALALLHRFCDEVPPSRVLSFLLSFTPCRS